MSVKYPSPKCLQIFQQKCCKLSKRILSLYGAENMWAEKKGVFIRRTYSTKSICTPSAVSPCEGPIYRQTHLDQMISWSCDTHVTYVSLTGAFVPILCCLEREKARRLAKKVAKQLTKILRCNHSGVHSAGPRTYLESIFFQNLTYEFYWKNHGIHSTKASRKMVCASDFLISWSWQTHSADFDNWV